jgi:diguanylate cyclase (GGDEF)-like protein/PAS domain S-box-containing protein
MTQTGPHTTARRRPRDADFLQRVIDATRDGILVARAIRAASGEILDFEMAFINRVLQDMLEPEGDWVGYRLREDLPGTLEDGRYQLLIDAVDSGQLCSTELEAVFRDGTRHWLSLAARARGDEVVLSLRDVTQDHETVAALAESERRYRELVEHQAELVCRFLPDTTILFANEAFARYYGHEPDALVGIRMLDLLPQARRRPAALSIGSLTPDRPSITDEGFLIAPDGTQRWQQWTTSAVVEDGVITEIQAVGIDITDRKRAEQAIRARSETLSLVTTLSLRFIDLPSDEFDSGIEASLADLGRSLGADRTYLVMYRPDRVTFDMTHEWCKDGIPSVRSFVSGHRDTDSPRMRALLHAGEPVCIESFDDLGPEWDAERELYRHTEVRSTIVAPIIDGGVLVGTVGFDDLTGGRSIAEHDVAALRSAAGVFGQVIARREAEVEMRQSEQRFRALVAGVPDLLVRVAGDGTVLDWRPPGGALEPSGSKEVGRPLASVFPELAPVVERVLARGVEGASEQASLDIEVDDRRASYDARVTLAGREAIAVVRDVTEQRELQISLLHQATHDALTGLANRRLFSEHLDAALDRGRDGGGFPAVLFIDLDRFKVLNDSQGHDVGDAVLREAARRIARSVRPGDVVARLGGDEFAVLVHRVGSVGDAVTLAERIVRVTSQPIDVDGDALVMTASVGVVLGGAVSSTASMLRDADAAMYEAKARGRQRVEVFTDAIHHAALARHQVEHELRRALELDELVLHYQPLWSLAHGRWVGAEALVRWHHPDRGVLSPAEFLPVAVDAGLMPALGAWVLDRACFESACWLDQLDDHLRVWINLSADQLSSKTLVSDVVDALEAHGVAATSVGVEVTETALVGDVALARSNLGRLRALGVGVALDDFGTGLSSLTHLDTLPLDVVKLDGAFVVGAGEPGRQHDLVDGIVRLLRRLGVEVLAERVEGPDELAALARLGVDTVQGYHLGRPMPVTELRGFLGRATRWD